MDDIKEEADMNEVNRTSSHIKENVVLNKSPKSSRQQSLRGAESAGHLNNGMNQADTSIEQLYENVCDMQSSDQSPSRLSLIIW